MHIFSAMNYNKWVIFLILAIVIKLIMSWIAANFLLTMPGKTLVYQFTSKEIEFVSVIILAPLFETFLFQLLPIELMNKFKKYISNQIVLVLGTLLSALLFAMNHFYSVRHLFVFLIIGLFYAVVYQIAKTQFNKAFVTVFIVHLVNNCVAFISRL